MDATRTLNQQYHDSKRIPRAIQGASLATDLNKPLQSLRIAYKSSNRAIRPLVTIRYQIHSRFKTIDYLSRNKQKSNCTHLQFISPYVGATEYVQCYLIVQLKTLTIMRRLLLYLHSISSDSIRPHASRQYISSKIHCLL